VRFEICDAEEDWEFNTKFDYIHGRMLTVCFRDVRDVFKKAFDALKPGGWLEMQDACFPCRSPDGSTEGTPLKNWFDKLLEGGASLGRPFGTEPPNYAMYLEQVGFVDIHVVVKQWPFGPWPQEKKMKELGLWSRANALEGLEAVSMAVFTRGLGWTSEQVARIISEVREDYMNPAIHSYIPV
jgi:hypothetical protein